MQPGIRSNPKLAWNYATRGRAFESCEPSKSCSAYLNNITLTLARGLTPDTFITMSNVESTSASPAESHAYDEQQPGAGQSDHVSSSLDGKPLARQKRKRTR